MFLYKPAFLYVVCTIVLSPASTRVNDDVTNALTINLPLDEELNAEEYGLVQETNAIAKPSDEKVKITLLYESLSPSCREFVTKQFAPTVKKLSPYLELETFPYGNAKTKRKARHFVFTCENGPQECYGNKLHACAINYLGYMTRVVPFNACMMSSDRKNRGSDDEAVDACAKQMGFNGTAIKNYAKTNEGSEYLAIYGMLSRQYYYSKVPYVLVNGKVLKNLDNFMSSVCAAFAKPPPPCSKLSYSSFSMV